MNIEEPPPPGYFTLKLRAVDMIALCLRRLHRAERILNLSVWIYFDNLDPYLNNLPSDQLKDIGTKREAAEAFIVQIRLQGFNTRFIVDEPANLK